MIPSGAAAKTQIDGTIARLADKIGKYSSIDIRKLQQRRPDEVVPMGEVIRAVAYSVLEDWFYGRDADVDQADQLDGPHAGQGPGRQA